MYIISKEYLLLAGPKRPQLQPKGFRPIAASVPNTNAFQDVQTGQLIVLHDYQEPQPVDGSKADLTLVYDPLSPNYYIFPEQTQIKILVQVRGDLDIPSGYWDVTRGPCLVKHNEIYYYRPVDPLPGHLLPHSNQARHAYQIGDCNLALPPGKFNAEVMLTKISSEQGLVDVLDMDTTRGEHTCYLQEP